MLTGFLSTDQRPSECCYAMVQTHPLRPPLSQRKRKRRDGQSAMRRAESTIEEHSLHSRSTMPQPNPAICKANKVAQGRAVRSFAELRLVHVSRPITAAEGWGDRALTNQ